MVKETVVFALTSSVDLAAEVCRKLEIPLGKIKVEHFADGEILVEPQESVRGRNVFIIQSTCNPVTERLMEVLICIDACKRASAGSINIIMPYYGYARQDRKAKPRQPITSKLVANLLQVAGANRILTFDLHAAQIQGYFDIPIDDLTAVPMIGQYFKEKNFDKEDLVVVSPDHGGVTRARRLADILEAPIAIIDKRRPKPNMVEAQNVIGDVEGKNCIVIDDICDTAGSLVAGCQILKDHGAKDIYTGITHGVFSRDALDKIEKSTIKEMVITDTIALTPEQAAKTTKITVLSVSEMIARTIDSIENHSPVSRVYNLYNYDSYK
ncbi:MAG: ribose-phosphate pyrophosphokinase [Erysipelotrichaceae bacterium]|nr:ribose-phosphate pyrophosphokinase [Erysipelotrichaceae bacterium]